MIYFLLLSCFISLFISVSYSTAQQKALKAALAVHGYTLVYSKPTRRRFLYMPPGSPAPSMWYRSATAFREVFFTDRNGNTVQCLAALQVKQLGKDGEAFFDIDLDTLQPH